MRFSRLRLYLAFMVPVVLTGCGYGHASLSLGSCPAYIDPAVVVRFEDRVTGRPLAVDASGVIKSHDSSQLLDVFEHAHPDPYVFSLSADVRYEDRYRIELFVARTLNSPLTEIVYEDVDIYFDSCGPITRYIDVRVD